MTAMSKCASVFVSDSGVEGWWGGVRDVSII